MAHQPTLGQLKTALDTMSPSSHGAPPSGSTSSVPPTAAQAPTAPSTSAAPLLSVTKSYRPFYSPYELNALVRLSSASIKVGGDGVSQRVELSALRIEQHRQVACGYIDRVGTRLGFPRRTIASGQTLYHRFHLHHQLSDYSYTDVSISALLVASKLEDTLKKLRDIQIAAWAVTNLLEGGTGQGEGDTQAQEAQRPQLIAIERLILQTLCFNFHPHQSLQTPELELLAGVGARQAGAPDEEDEEDAGLTRDAFGWVIRIGRALNAPKSFLFLAHLLVVDVHRTTAPLSYPSHTLALACIYLATFLTPGHANCAEWRGAEVTREMRDRAPVLGQADSWPREFASDDGDVREIAHALLDLFILLCPPSLANRAAALPAAQSSKASPSFSPSTPRSMPSPAPADPIAYATATSSALSGPARERDREKEKQILNLGVPHSLSVGIALPLLGSSIEGRLGIAARSEDDFTRIKIKLRSYDAASPQQAMAHDPEEEQRFRAKRWKGSREGWEEVEDRRRDAECEDAARKADEAELGERSREREKDRQRARRPISTRYRF